METVVNSIYRRMRRIGSPFYQALRDAKRMTEFSRARRSLFSTGLTDPELRLLQQVSLKVSGSDQMHGPSDSAWDYLTAGLSARRCIQAAIDASGRSSPIESILDFPCGYGRVLRFLKVMFPDAAIVGGEVDSDMLDFCRRTFSIETILSKGDFDHLDFSRRFDFIWCGSLATHLDEKSTAGLMRFFYRHLRDGGTCVFTTHGQFIIELMRGKKMFRLTPESDEKILRDFERHGYGYADYRNGPPGWGISASSHSRIAEMARNVGPWKETLFLDHGWHNFQDVYAFTRTSAP